MDVYVIGFVYFPNMVGVAMGEGTIKGFVSNLLTMT
jgi:hypothetical protein